MDGGRAGPTPAFAERSRRLASALDLARQSHAGQVRKGDGLPYVVHPIAVAELLADAGFDEPVLAAALLHDVVERSDVGAGDIARGFGEEVAGLVAALSEDPAIDDYERRKDAHREQVAAAGARAVAIYVADKLANLRDMRELYARVGESAGERFTAPTLDLRVDAWRGDVEMARAVAPDTPLLPRLAAELSAFEADRAARRAGAGADG